ncbi:hypothetical protein IQ260_09290 [Leptolyngbya cf. ectocarpi LEGE 11479]|uniref:Uncharacterized protein n=1 Tax=Leptolyngbya cf. ectocarpi LEGE 11479 TaxID=1828722 RepID=A0A928X306_LEPEC|nr:hypothetical protein [Leptolyngbya ectocarpi]MBE9066846.1 hypothetical protein [Leptolyngbya cf. ectocarpi LEGE 11479]
MSRPKQQSPRPLLDPRLKSQKTTGKLKYFRPMPYHIALSQAARLEAWTEEVEGMGGPAEAADSSDFDPRLMERQQTVDL